MVTVSRRFAAVLHVVLVIVATLPATAGCGPTFSPEHPLTHESSISQLQRIPDLMHRYGIFAEPFRRAALVVSPDP